MTRQPEENIKVFELGHYEQMQLALALAFTVAEFSCESEDRPGGENGIWELVSPGALTNLATLFDGQGTVTIIRHEEER